MTSVAICIPTYKRPESLILALESVSRLIFPKHPETQVRVVVVDNDPLGSAEQVVEEVKDGMPWPITYSIEKQPGVSYVRNRCVQLSGNVNFVAFFDDDATVDAVWLDKLLAAQKAFKANVVVGPVFYQFETEPPAWIKPFFKTINYPMGPSAYFRTGNVLIEKHILDALLPPFDPFFSLTGGEDTALGARLRALEVKSFWASDALVFEKVPIPRLCASWIIRRAFRKGNALALVDRRYPSHRFSFLIRMLKAISRIGIGLVSLPLNILCWRKYFVLLSVNHIAGGLGSLIGLFGIRFKEYKRIHGS